MGAGLSVGPSVGITVGASQRLINEPDFDLHLEIEIHRQDLDPVDYEGERFDGNWDQVRGGLKLVLPGDEDWDSTVRFGITWVRPVGDPVFVDKPEDFGGFHFGLGRERLLSPRLLFTPDLALIGLFEESDGESGLGLQLTLRFQFLP
ncbi:MAG: hypothetical protein ACI8QS_001716 [Planctomycetota bacterium]